MATITLSLVNKDGDVLGTSTGDTLVHLDTRYSEYQPGDILVLESDQDSIELEVQLDESLPPSVIVLKGGRFEFPIPFVPIATVIPSRPSPATATGATRACSIRASAPTSVTSP